MTFISKRSLMHVKFLADPLDDRFSDETFILPTHKLVTLLINGKRYAFKKDLEESYYWLNYQQAKRPIIIPYQKPIHLKFINQDDTTFYLYEESTFCSEKEEGKIWLMGILGTLLILGFLSLL
jgi:hypothetical protein